MRILKLTAKTESTLLKSRQQQDISAQKTAARIVADVRRGGDRALADWTRKLDGTDIDKSGLWIAARERTAAKKRVNPEFLRALAHAAKNVRAVAEKQLPRDWTLAVEPGVQIQQVVRPIYSIGCYIPGGRFALVSTLVMTIVPAQVAGVKRIVAVCPHPNDELLAAAEILGVTELARVGGAQAIAALAYGTKKISPVAKIFGPGNRYVTAAKQLISCDCAIDLPAGPTEALVLANDGNPEWVAADLLAQAEHAPDAGSFLVTTSVKFATRVQAAVHAQLNKLPANTPAHISTLNSCAILLASSWKDAIAFVNRFAPEHLSLPQISSRLPKEFLSAGTVFLGPLSAQPFGDYASGSNHVLPTGGWAQRRGGLSAADFVKCISVQTVKPQGFRRLADDVQTLAKSEGLHAHSNAVEVRR